MGDFRVSGSNLRRVALAGASLLALPALAQTAPQPAAPANAQQAEPPRQRTVPAGAPSGDIIVSARRRSEVVQKVPLAISVLDARAIDATGSSPRSSRACNSIPPIPATRRSISAAWASRSA
jgi:hypothetical protein